MISLALLLLAGSVARADEMSVATNDAPRASYGQLLTLQAGPFRPASLGISNGSYRFDYDSSLVSSVMVEAGWSARLVESFASLHLQEGISGTGFSGSAQAPGLAGFDGRALTVGMLGFDTRLVAAFDRSPLPWFIPFVEGGYRVTLYYQSGSSDLDSAQGGVGNWVAGAGLRLWLNRTASMSDDHLRPYNAIPIFLTAKVNRIFPSGSALDLGSAEALGGIGIGL